MSEKYPLLAEEEECFFLTSPFIEPDGLERDDKERCRRPRE
jgi:hypothetical protein